MKFNVLLDDEKIECNIVKLFKNADTGINYIVYTDGSLDDDGSLSLFASRYIIQNGNYVLDAITDDAEWDYVDHMLEKEGN